MFDPVSDHARRIFILKREDFKSPLHKCRDCGKTISKLYNKRCIKCAIKIEEAKFHHRFPELTTEKKRPLKKKIDTPLKRKK